MRRNQAVIINSQPLTFGQKAFANSINGRKKADYPEKRRPNGRIDEVLLQVKGKIHNKHCTEQVQNDTGNHRTIPEL